MVRLEPDIGHFILENLFNFMAIVFLHKVVEEVYRSPAENAAKQRAEKQAKQDVDNAILQMRREFEDHPVTRELDGGIGASNISKTLLGKSGPQNLFSFIGFEGGSDPLQPIRRMFEDPDSMGIKVKYLRKSYKSGSLSITYSFEVTKPKIPESVLKEASIPWAKGWSWIDKIETGIPGFAYFLSRFGQKNSRSGGGIQIGEDKVPLRSSQFNPPENGYLKAIFKTFMDKVKAANY